MNIRRVPNGFSGYGSSEGMGQNPNPRINSRGIAAGLYLEQQAVPNWAFGGGGGVSSSTSQAGFPGPLPIAWTEQVAVETFAKIPA